MKRSIVLIVALFAGLAFGQDLATYNKALSAYNASNFDESARLFYEVYGTTTDADLRLKAEYYLASSFQRLNLAYAANVYFSSIVKAGPSHPFHLKSVESLVTLQEVMNDDFLIPTLLNRLYDQYADAWATLPLEVLARINYLIGRISYRDSKFEDARQFFEAVPSSSAVYAKAQYMLATTLAHPKFPAATDEDRLRTARQSADVYQSVLKILSPNQRDLAETHQLATLGLGRVHYNIGEYQKSVEWYERIPRFSRYWDQSLFENGFARFQNDDLGGGLGSLQALHAPQFAGAFQPESWIQKSIIYYFACLYEESKSALVEFEGLYLPMAEKLKPLVEGEPKDPSVYFKLVDVTESEQIPRPVLNYVRSNERMLGLFALLKQIDQEKQAVAANQSWKSAKLSDELVTFLDENRGNIEGLAGRIARGRLVEAFGVIKFYTDQAEIIRFETSKAEKEMAEQGINQAGMLSSQSLYRPKMPAENWNYWKFQGEFWRDEIGYYQYTLKRACPANR